MDCGVHGFAKSQTRLSGFHLHFHGVNFPGSSAVRTRPTVQETQRTRVQLLGQEEPWRRARQPTPVFLVNPMDRGA